MMWEIMSYGERPYWDWGNSEVRSLTALVDLGKRNTHCGCCVTPYFCDTLLVCSQCRRHRCSQWYKLCVYCHL